MKEVRKRRRRRRTRKEIPERSGKFELVKRTVSLVNTHTHKNYSQISRALRRSLNDQDGSLLVPAFSIPPLIISTSQDRGKPSLSHGQPLLPRVQHASPQSIARDLVPVSDHGHPTETVGLTTGLSGRPSQHPPICLAQSKDFGLSEGRSARLFTEGIWFWSLAISSG